MQRAAAAEGRSGPSLFLPLLRAFHYEWAMKARATTTDARSLVLRWERGVWLLVCCAFGCEGQAGLERLACV